MDNYLYKTPDNYRLIKGIFYILFMIVGIGLLAFFTLEIHLTANSTDGEIISRNAPTIYMAPYEASLAKMMVEEGKQVKEGDTLMVLINQVLMDEYQLNLQKLKESSGNIDILKKQLTNLEKRKYTQKNDIDLINRKQKNQKKNKTFEVKALKQQLDLLEQKMLIAKRRIEKDKQLKDKGGISEKEYDKRYQQFLEESNTLTQMKNEAFQKRNEGLDTEYETQISQQKLEILNTDAKRLDLKQLINKEEALTEQVEAKIESLEKELQKQYIVASYNGYVSKVFNTKSEINIIAKGQTLLTLSPKERETFYAKLAVQEEELKDIKIGQNVHLKINAYNHYQFGVLKAQVTHIDRDEHTQKEGSSKSNTFYVLADIEESSNASIEVKGGLKAQGEIIIDKVKLYQFATNKLFKKL